jgi:hypothetical protein
MGTQFNGHKEALMGIEHGPPIVSTRSVVLEVAMVDDQTGDEAADDSVRGGDSCRGG